MSRRPCRRLDRAARAVLAASLAACSACDRAPSEAAPAGGPARIVSLSPALTHTAALLGAGDAVVGATPWCGIARATVVGSLEDRNLEAIAALRPTVILRQSTAEDPALAAVAASSGAWIGQWRLDSIGDVRACLPQLGDALAARGIAGADAAARRILSEHQERTVARVAAPGPVLFLFSVDPPAAFGAGTYVDELWAAMGGRNAVSGRGYPSLTAEDIVRMAPTAIVRITADGAADAPAWASSVGCPWIALRAPELLEPGASMLLDGPASLRRADAAVAGTTDGGEAAP